MNCKIDGCTKPAMYIEQRVCQKHYFRFMRNGRYELEPRSLRIENDAGYQLLWAPAHPLANKIGYVFEHRAVVYADIGCAPMACEMCGVCLTWKTCKVDHIDEDVRNNQLSNLRPTCNRCNTGRGKTRPSTWSRTHKITHDGLTLTPAEWARDPRVEVAGRTIVLRKSRGATDEEALFSPKKTHNGRTQKDRRAKCKELEREG